MNSEIKNILNQSNFNEIYGSVIVKNNQNQFLILRRSENDDGAGLWDLPGGSGDKNSDPEMEASRELLEEAGIESGELEFIDSWNFVIEKTGASFQSFCFYTFSGQEPKLNWEHDQYRWVYLKEAQELLWNKKQTECIKKVVSKIYPAFSQEPEDINLESDFGERGIALIKIQETGEFIIYDKAFRQDKRARLPGGHIDPGENSLEAAIRETEEEVGLVNQSYKGYLGSSHGFYNWGGDSNKIIHKLDHFYYFQTTLKNWTGRKPGIEKDIKCFLADEKYLKENTTAQLAWVLKNIEKLD